jgi:hypothetical protein
MPRKMLPALTLALLISAPALAQPNGLHPGCEQSYGRYAAAPAPKAFAMGKTMRCGWWSNTSNIVQTIQEVKELSIKQCASYGGDNCRVVDSSAK